MAFQITRTAFVRLMPSKTSPHQTSLQEIASASPVVLPAISLPAESPLPNKHDFVPSLVSPSPIGLSMRYEFYRVLRHALSLFAILLARSWGKVCLGPAQE